MKLSLLSLTILFTLTSCIYKMPNNDSISTLPNTNNPHVTGEKPRSLIPGR
ncbi:MAG: hypothetical protein R3E91_05990 [Chlamydiales bacterium]